MTNAPRRDLGGRKILLIGIGFYDYENSIARRLSERGADVSVFQDQPKQLRSGIRRRLIRNHNALIHRHEERILAEARLKCFNQVLVIKGVGLRVPFLQALRDTMPKCEFILYQWDSLARLDGIEERLPFFDRTLTFDRKDALERKNILFRPLFFRESLAPINDQDIDIAFVGWLHSERLESIRRMKDEAKSMGLKTYVYLYTGWLTWFKLLIRGNAEDVYPRPLSYRKLVDINSRTRCIYDLPHALQSGLTMRAIEALGAGKKLLTTARDIVNYDFYCPNNVRVLVAPDSGLDLGFVTSKPSRVNELILHRYSLDAWIDDLLK